MSKSATIESTIESVNALLEGTTIAPIATTGVLAWRTRPASRTQVSRIMRLEEAILESGNKAAIKRIKRHHGVFANAGDASDYYKPLSTTGNALGLRWSA